ncbi:IclR family transcriptional regulator [Catenovulum sediminis]|uniref:IclR family transcriptional regulator n=1 Tax=Catenovulum sediminis TaxID=1740262 RepID=A0ABV1RJN3_9ALTE|nr:IclR family transcriptional regulator [Catenovulum sediminis]
MLNTEKSKLKSARYTAPALEKGLDIIELLARQHEGLRLKDIAANLGKSVSEIFRMVTVLEGREYLKFDPLTDRYSLSLKLFEIASQNTPVERVTRAAASEMDQLSKQINQSCYLTTRYENESIVLLHKDGPMDAVISVRLGAKRPLTDSSSGHVFLAHAVDDSIEHSAGFTAQLKAIKEQGYALTASTLLSGVEEIAFPIFDKEEKITACLVISYLNYLNDATQDKLAAINLAKEAAARISKRLGMPQKSN